MRLYDADLLAISHRIPYFDKNVLFIFHEMFDNYLYYYRDKKIHVSGWNIRDISDIFKQRTKLVVRRRNFHMVEDIETGIVFPQIKFIDKKVTYDGYVTCPEKCILYQPNCRLYVRLNSKMNQEQIEQFYSSRSPKILHDRQKYIKQIMEQESQYWNPLPEQSQYVKKKSNRQYVKMIEQMRNQDGNN